jgi:uncharacterized membrane protein
MGTLQRIVFLLIAFAVVQSGYYYPQLPETVATHFNSAGEPNGWASKTSFFLLYIGMLAIVAGVFLVLPARLASIPLWMVNLPNKKYWLAPARSKESIEIIRREMLVLGCATLIFLICIIQLVIEANVNGTFRLSSSTVWILLSVFLAFTVVWTFRFVSRFSGLNRNRPAG